jgi:peroxiredoxin Q/BCP
MPINRREPVMATKKAKRLKSKPRSRPKVKPKARASNKARKPVTTGAPKTLPAIEVQATGGKRFKLSALKGQPVVIYFYPKDDTPGCTQEGCDLRDNYGTFTSRGVTVLGVSRDPLASHDRFREKYRFPFDLISDLDERLCRAFGVMKEKTLYGRKHTGVERSTFVYDRDGRLRREFRGVKVPGHVMELLKEFDKP